MGVLMKDGHSRNVAGRCCHDGFARVLVERLELELELGWEVPKVLGWIAWRMRIWEEMQWIVVEATCLGQATSSGRRRELGVVVVVILKL